jgi:hypothetical protein
MMVRKCPEISECVLVDLAAILANAAKQRL